MAARSGIDDSEASVTERNVTLFAEPVPLTIWPTMRKQVCEAADRSLVNWTTVDVSDAGNSTHFYTAA
jgi:hypothetical protein